MAQSHQQTAAEKAEAEKKAQAPAPGSTPVIPPERVPVGQNVVTDRTEETADQLARGVSPVSDDASAKAERAVADEPTPAARDQAAHDRLDALEADVKKLRAQLRHAL